VVEGGSGVRRVGGGLRRGGEGRGRGCRVISGGWWCQEWERREGCDGGGFGLGNGGRSGERGGKPDRRALTMDN